MNYLIDTNIIIDFLRKQEYAFELMQKVRKESIPTVSAVTVAELLAGCDLQKRCKIEEFLAHFNIAEIDFEISKSAGIYVFDYARQGIALDLQDAYIGATAVLKKMILVTRNKKHFPMPKLNIYSL